MQLRHYVEMPEAGKSKRKILQPMLKTEKQNDSANEGQGKNRRNSISGLCSSMKLSRQGVTKHLRVLKNAGIVKSTKVGREPQFLLVPETLTPLQ